QVHLAWATVHEEVDHGPRLRLEVRRARLKVVARTATLARGCWQNRAAIEVPAEEMSQGGAVKPTSDAVEETAPAEQGVAHRPFPFLLGHRSPFNRRTGTPPSSRSNDKT